MAIVSPAVPLAGNFTIPAALVLLTKYPLPATIVVTVLPSDTTTDCHAILPAETEPPNAIAAPFIVIVEFASFALAILPANLALVIVPGVISASTIVPSSILAALTELSVIPDLVTFVSAMLILSYYL